MSVGKAGNSKIRISFFSNETSNFVKTMGKSHKITSYLYDKSKILGPKIWSQGTNLGYLGPGSQADLDGLF